MIKKIIYIVIKKLITYFIKFNFIKKDNKKITFISFPDLSDNSWHLFYYINKNKNYLNLVWLIDKNLSNIKINYLKKINKKNRILFVKKRSLQGVYHFLSSRIVFFTHNSYFFSQKNLGPTQVNLWHGMPIKKIGFYRHKKHLYFYGDFTISTSNLYKKVMSKAFGINTKSIILCGLPRNDVLKSGNKKKFYFLSEKKLKMVLWLPTFRKTNVFSEINDSENEHFLDEWPNDFLKNLNFIAKQNKILLTIKLHPLDKYKKKNKKYSNISFLENINLTNFKYDLQDLISFSDGLISDISSVIIDYILVKKPLGITTNSLETFSRGLIRELKLFENLKFHNIKSLNDFNIFFKKVNKSKKTNIDPKNIFYSKNVMNSSKQLVEYFNI